MIGRSLVFDFFALFYRGDVLLPDHDRIAVPLFAADQIHRQEKRNDAAEHNRFLHP